MIELPMRHVVPAQRFDEARLAAWPPGRLAAWMTASVDGYRGPLRVQQF